MHKLEAHIDRNWKQLRDKKLVVACSGGLDSICLTYLLHSLGYDLTVIHVNYQLRGQDSEDDAEFVSKFCSEISIPFIQRTVDLKKQLEHGGNLQQAARDFRYEWFNELKSTNENAYVALAHHRDDQIETFLLNLARKSGVMGLAAMPYERDRIIRPLLDFSKNDLINYANEKSIQWREDKSNVSNKYRRNLLRNEIIPFLNEKISDFDESVLFLVKHFQEKQKELEEIIHPIIDAVTETKMLSIDRYLKLDDLERNEFFRQLDQPSSKSIELESLSHTQKGKIVELLLGANNPFKAIVKENDFFVFMPIEEKMVHPVLVMKNVESLPTTFSKDSIYLDADKIKGELKIRAWQIGDRMNPVGISGSKLISDIIAEGRVSANEKDRILVLHDEVAIHWCVGLKIGAKAVATSETVRLVKCSVRS